jgi:recombination protein RecA
MVLCMANAQKQGYKPVIIDTEGGIDEQFCRRWGLDPDNCLYIYTPWIDEVKSTLAQIKATEEEGYVIGIDSVGGIDRYKSYADAAGGKLVADQGLLQKEIRSMLKLFVNICVGQNSIGIASGHYYGKPAQIPLPDQIGGGKAMKLFPSIIVTLKKETMTDESNKVIGNKIIATTIKNRVYPPYQTATVQIDYKNGVNAFAGILDLGIELGLIEKSGSWYSYGDTRLGQGVKNAESALLELKDDIMEKIDKLLETTGYSSYDENVKKAEEIVQQLEEDNESGNVQETKRNRRRKRDE